MKFCTDYIFKWCLGFPYLCKAEMAQGGNGSEFSGGSITEGRLDGPSELGTSVCTLDV